MATKISEQEKKRAAKEFAAFWKDKGYEKGESQKFWIELLTNVYGVSDATRYIEFEDQVKMDTTSFIDGYISETKVLIEQKSIDKDLLKPIRQSNGQYLTPFQQAKNYSANLPYSRRPRWIITCNFKEFYIYDMENPNAEPEILLLKNIEKEYHRMDFLVDTKNEYIKKEMKVSIEAGEIVGHIYDEIKKQYIDPDAPESLRSLNILCVRLVFCLYAEDADVFNRLLFHDFIKGHNSTHLNKALEELFEVLNTPEDERSPYLPEDLQLFPFVNGGLFEDEDNNKNVIPRFTEELKQYLIKDASEGFDWSEISPTIFGAIFESTLNPETRRDNGMHYTSIKNIHKVIDPLFLNELRDELEKIKTIKADKTRISKAEEYCSKLSDLKFLDPACGSGNFLTETYLSLRTLENEALTIIHKGNIAMNLSDRPNDNIKVTIDQFYGIEINDFAVSVAKTALWIAESQMLKKTEEIIQTQLKFLPLTTNAFIKEGNALRIEWNEVVNKNELNYIIGNPPFVGSSRKDAKSEQKKDMATVFGSEVKHGKLDYVAAWYWKSANFIQGKNIKCAFLSTNSITQGEQVALLWKPLFEKKNIEINYAYRSFSWTSEAIDNASVVVIIVGFSYKGTTKDKYLFIDNEKVKASYINGYLYDLPDIFIQGRGKNLSGLPKMIQGNKPWDGGFLLYSEKEYKDFIKKYPEKTHLLKPFYGGDELLRNKKRYCLWLKGVSPAEYAKIPEIRIRLSNVRETRLNTKTAAVREQAETPMLFSQIRQPMSDYMALPEVSTSSRKYIPIGFLTSDDISSNKLFIIPNSTKYMFGVLISNVHMNWMYLVAGRLGTGYSYSPSVYNNFPWCNPTPEQKAKIEKTAQAILDARALYPDSSLADLYDELTMPPELRKAHQENDRAVMQAYGFSLKMTESECVAELMKMYSKLTENK